MKASAGTVTKHFMRPIATEIVRRLQAAGHEAYFVGGCVRDQLLGLEPQDYELKTPDEARAWAQQP